ncbi:MAG: putative ABC transporter permease [Hespellia sp.]|nr:putative ABC transporter permease [Hespellia sp.]
MISFSELLWLFFIYSFGGWILETVLAAIRQKKFINRGLITGPFCIIYGLAAVLISVGLKELTGIWLFLFAMVIATVVEWVGGHLIEKFFGKRWWDYSNIKHNLDGYICLPVSLVWGALGYVTVRWGNGFILDVLLLIPELIQNIIIFTLSGLMVLDTLASYLLLTGRSKQLEKWEKANNNFARVSHKLGKWITYRIEKRIFKAYPKTEEPQSEIYVDKTRFAYGCSFYKIVLLFFIGAFLGDVAETIFCRITTGGWMSRSSVVWGPFSIVWGLAIAMATLMLYKYKDRTDSFLFGVGTLLGGAYEYLCSVFTEIVFGKVFWDYSKLPFNLGGRINLLYCFFWGIAAVLWFKKLYPVASKWIEKIPKLAGKMITWLLIVFMCCNVAVSCMSLIRYEEREKDVKAENTIQIWLDEHYNDQMMEKIYPNAITVDK